MKKENLKFNVLRLLETKGIGVVRFWAIWEQLKKIDLNENIFDLSIMRSVLKAIEYDRWVEGQQKAQKNWKKILEKNVNVVFAEDDEYPKFLIECLGKKAPPILFVLGNSDLLKKKSVGFCGAREASQKGLETANDCASQLAEKGINVVSGYARGVDMATHKAALNCGGTTAIILAEGILNFKIKKELVDIWNWEKIVVVSEFLPGLTWSIGNAMQRNKTIIGLSQAMVLIEAKSRGGSFEAGKSSLDLKIPLFAPVYEGLPDSCIEGNRELLNQGAFPLFKSQKSKKANITDILRVVENGQKNNEFAVGAKPIGGPQQQTFFNY